MNSNYSSPTYLKGLFLLPTPTPFWVLLGVKFTALCVLIMHLPQNYTPGSKTNRFWHIPHLFTALSLFYVCGVLTACVSGYHVPAVPSVGRRGHLGCLKLELKTVVSCCVVHKNQTQVLCKRNQCS